MSGACLGQSKISAVLHASLMPFLRGAEKEKRPKVCFSSSDVEINFTFSFQLTVNINGSSLEVEVLKKLCVN